MGRRGAGRRARPRDVAEAHHAEPGGRGRALLVLAAAAVAVAVAVVGRDGVNGGKLEVNGGGSADAAGSASVEVDPASVERAKASNNLLRSLKAAGATVNHAIKAGATPGAGVGIFFRGDRAAPAGTTMLVVPGSLMLHPEGKGVAGLALALAQARRDTNTSEVTRKFIASLPAACPENVLAWDDAARELVAASMHSWKVTSIPDARRAVVASLWGATQREADWALCMVLSRSLAAPGGKGSVMVPFVDLLNHHLNGSVFMAIHPDRLEIVATRTIEPGEELTWEYLASPSRARLLTSFGFGGRRDAPAASLAAKDLPRRDPEWFARHGCPRVPRTDLEVDPVTGKIDDAAVRVGLRCIRLQLYTPDEAEWALASGHLDAPWDGQPVTEADGVLHSVLSKDLVVVSNTGRQCHESLPDAAGMQRFQNLLGARNDALQNALIDEINALIGCSSVLRKAHNALASRLQGGHNRAG